MDQTPTTGSAPKPRKGRKTSNGAAGKPHINGNGKDHDAMSPEQLAAQGAEWSKRFNAKRNEERAAQGLPPLEEAKPKEKPKAHPPEGYATRKELLEDYKLIPIMVGGAKNGFPVPQALLANFLTLFEQHPLFNNGGVPRIRFDMDAGVPLFNGEAMVENVTDAEITRMFQRDLGFSGGQQTAQPAAIRDALRSVLAANAFSPFNDDVRAQAARLRGEGEEAMAEADRKLNQWAVECLGAPADGWSEVWGRKLIVMQVMRAMRPGCHMRVGFGLVGPPGIGKTPLMKAIVGDENTKIISKGNAAGKDLLITTSQALSVVLDEGAGIKAMGVEGFKSFISQQEDDFRMPYASRNERHRRRSVVFIPSNDTKYLQHDTTGNTKVALLDLSGHREKGQVFDFAKIEAWRGDMLGAALIALEGGEDAATFEGIEAHAQDHVVPNEEEALVADMLESAAMAPVFKVGDFRRQFIVGFRLAELQSRMESRGMPWRRPQSLSVTLKQMGWHNEGDKGNPLGLQRLWWMPFDEFSEKYVLEGANKVEGESVRASLPEGREWNVRKDPQSAQE